LASVRRGRTWSGPQVISGPLSSTVMEDRFQPWLTVDGAGLHAMWCERIADPNGGPDFISADKADLSLAIRHRAPAPINGGEAAMSTGVPGTQHRRRLLHGRLQPDCYERSQALRELGRYSRNVVDTPSGRQHQSDIFAQAY